MKQFNNYLVFFLILIATFLRFYNLNWGSPYYFNPDERQNVVYPVLESKSIFMLDQKNFDTGTFPLIVIKIIYNSAKQFLPNVDQTMLVILIARGLSAAISVAISLLLFFIVRKIFGGKQALITLFLSIFSVGFIQFAHFGTIELWEALFFLIIFYYAWKITKNRHFTDNTTAGVILGVAISTKILSLILAPAILFAHILYLYKNYKSKYGLRKNLKKTIAFLFAFGASVLIAFCLTSLPFLTNLEESQRSINFESDVALGKLAVFYTQGFFNTIPVIFQFTDVFPFLLNPVLTIIFIPSFFYVLYLGLKTKNPSYQLLVISFLLLFLSQSFFFVKWTRYMVPVLPFIYMIIGIAIASFLSERSESKDKGSLRRAQAKKYFVAIILFTCSLFSVSFFITVYLNTPTPVAAASFALRNIPPGSKVLSEPYDLGLTAFPPNLTIEQFNFYDLDSDNYSLEHELNEKIIQSEYVIIPSQRLLKSRLSNPKKFPKGHGFYFPLTKEALGFEKIYETPCNIFCKITYLGDPVFRFEETANVFDRPTVLIFKKIN